MLARPLAALGLRPQQVTLAGPPLALLAAGATIAGHPGPATVLAALALLTDFLDGALARLQQNASPWGNLLDAVVDRWVEAILLLGLAASHPYLAIATLGLSQSLSYIKARTGLVVVSDNEDWPGVGDRSDRCFLLLLAIAWPPGRLGLLWGLCLICLLGVTQRLRFARALLETRPLLPYLAKEKQSANNERTPG